LAKASSQTWIALVTAQLTWLGLFFGKRWEVISDGARGIGDGIGGVKGTLNAAEQKRKAKQKITQTTQVDGIANTNP
jgi:hypothetical protein